MVDGCMAIGGRRFLRVLVASLFVGDDLIVIERSCFDQLVNLSSS